MRPNTQELHMSPRKELFFNVPANTSHNGEHIPRKTKVIRLELEGVTHGSAPPLSASSPSQVGAGSLTGVHWLVTRTAKGRTGLVSRNRPMVRLTLTKGWVSMEKPVWALCFFPALAHKISWAKSSPWGQLFALPEHFQIPVEYLSVQRVGWWVPFML